MGGWGGGLNAFILVSLHVGWGGWVGGGLNAFILVSSHVCFVAVDWFSWGRRGFDVEGAAFMSGPRRWAHSMDASLSLPSAVCLTRAATAVSYVLLRLCGAGWFGELRPFWACHLPLLTAHRFELEIFEGIRSFYCAYKKKMAN